MSPQQRAEETRSRILTAAEESFAHYGYDVTGVAEICRRAGVSKGAFYHHFPSKQAVFLELLELWLAELDRQMETIRATAENVPAALRHMASMAEVVFRAADGKLPIFLEFWTKAAHDPGIWQAMIAHYRRYREFFASMIENGIAEGTLQPTDPETTAQIIVSLAVGLVLQGLLDPHGANWGHAAQEGMHMILKSLERS